MSSSTPPASSRAGGQGLLRVVSGSELDDRDRAAANANMPKPEVPASDIGSYIHKRWNEFRNARNSGYDPLNARLLRAQRMFEGKYDPDKLQQIIKFGGSQVYTRLVAEKCRGATSLLRDVYLGPDRPWAIDPQPDPPVPAAIASNIMQLVNTEVGTMKQAGQPVLPEQAHMRMTALMHAAEQAARRNAMMQADSASDKIDDMLVAGDFYKALTEFLTDLPLFPFACMKGPVVRMTSVLTWVGGKPVMKKKPQMFWERVSPFNIYWTPGASVIEDADVIERVRYTRADLNALLGLPGYDEPAVRAALQDYGRGLREWLDAPDSEQALNEGREDPNTNTSGMIDGLIFSGRVQGAMLLDNGMDPAVITDPDRDYAVQSWVVGRHTLKTQVNPDPSQRHPYYITSYEKVPGTISGHGLPDLLEDLQEIANACLRNTVNNAAIASGPQVVVNTDALSPVENGDELYPWKRWQVMSDPVRGSVSKPIEFFQPSFNANELFSIYQQVTQIADEVSAIPRYLTGNPPGGGAGRTASGLSMLMGNASKVLQTVASNVDTDVIDGILKSLYNIVMLTDTSGLLTGDEQIRVRGVNVAVQRDTERQKQLQFLQMTANPIDAPIVGTVGRARVLRAVAAGLGLPDDIVPGDQELQAKEQAQQQMQQAQAAMNPQQPGPGQPQPGASPAGQAAGAQPPQPTPARLSDSAPPVNLQQSLPGVHPG